MSNFKKLRTNRTSTELDLNHLDSLGDERSSLDGNLDLGLTNDQSPKIDLFSNAEIAPQEDFSNLNTKNSFTKKEKSLHQAEQLEQFFVTNLNSNEGRKKILFVSGDKVASQNFHNSKLKTIRAMYGNLATAYPHLTFYSFIIRDLLTKSSNQKVASSKNRIKLLLTKSTAKVLIESFQAKVDFERVGYTSPLVATIVNLRKSIHNKDLTASEQAAHRQARQETGDPQMQISEVQFDSMSDESVDAFANLSQKGGLNIDDNGPFGTPEVVDYQNLPDEDKVLRNLPDEEEPPAPPVAAAETQEGPAKGLGGKAINISLQDLSNKAIADHLMSEGFTSADEVKSALSEQRFDRSRVGEISGMVKLLSLNKQMSELMPKRTGESIDEASTELDFQF